MLTLRNRKKNEFSGKNWHLLHNLQSLLYIIKKTQINTKNRKTNWVRGFYHAHIAKLRRYISFALAKVFSPRGDCVWKVLQQQGKSRYSWSFLLTFFLLPSSSLSLSSAIASRRRRGWCHTISHLPIRPITMPK